MNEKYESLSTISLVVISGFVLQIIISIFSMFTGAGMVVSPSFAVHMDDGSAMSVWILMVGLLGLITIPIGVATVIVFLIWLYRSHKNLYALRPTALNFSPGWAVGWWFVPFLAFYKPFQVVREVWWESDPEIPEGVFIFDHKPAQCSAIHDLVVLLDTLQHLAASYVQCS